MSSKLISGFNFKYLTHNSTQWQNPIKGTKSLIKAFMHPYFYPRYLHPKCMFAYFHAQPYMFIQWVKTDLITLNITLKFWIKFPNEIFTVVAFNLEHKASNIPLNSVAFKKPLIIVYPNYSVNTEHTSKFCLWAKCFTKVLKKFTTLLTYKTHFVEFSNPLN